MDLKPGLSSSVQKVLAALGYAVSAVLAFIFIVNVTMIVKSYTQPEKVPDFLGYKPFIVLSGSMEPAIMAGDLILTKGVDPYDIQVGDVISFRVKDDVVVSHRVVEIANDGGLSFLTKGDANVGMDATMVYPEDLEGLYIWRGAGLGRFAIFLQTPIGMLSFVVAPLCLFIIYDIMGRNRRSAQKSSRESELEAEIAALKAEKERGLKGNVEEK